MRASVVTAWIVLSLGLGVVDARSAGLPENGEDVEAAEPLAIEETVPTERGHWAVRVQSDLPLRAADGVEERVASQGGKVYIGLRRGVSAEIGLPFVSNRTAGETRSGFGGLGLGLKAQLPFEAPVVVRGEVQLPASEEAFGESSAEFEVAAATLVRSGAWTLQGGPGYSVLEDGSERNVFVESSLAAAVGERWHALLEVIALRELETQTNSLAVGPGVRAGFAGNWSLAAGVLSRHVESAHDWRALLQVQRDF